MNNEKKSTKNMNHSQEKKQEKHFEFKTDGNLNPTQLEEVTKMLKQQSSQQNST